MTAANVSWFADIGLADRPSVGGKAANLGELTRAGIAPPPGFAIRTEAFERFLATLEAEAPVRAAADALADADLARIETGAAAIRARFLAATFPDDLRAELIVAHARLVAGGEPHVAVRSSATSEDAAEASFAGLQDTYLWVAGPEAMLDAVKRCWASLYSTPALTYRRKNKIPEAGASMGVVVQVMVDARTAGVMFTRSPLTGDRSVVVIEAAWGLGSALVGGEVTPDRFVIGKIAGEITKRDISEKLIEQVPAAAGGVETRPVPADRAAAPCVSDEELAKLLDIAKRVEKHYAAPQDIEWAIDRARGGIHLLQSRPETVWANREAAPAATTLESPHLHVMRIFSGRRP
jgi:pyruvate,water dikinase